MRIKIKDRHLWIYTDDNKTHIYIRLDNAYKPITFECKIKDLVKYFDNIDWRDKYIDIHVPKKNDGELIITSQ